MKFTLSNILSSLSVVLVVACLGPPIIVATVEDITVEIPVGADNIQRSAIVHLPPGVEWKKKPVPLVLNLHALLSTNTLQKEYSKFNELSDSTKEFIVAYPQGLALGQAPQSWGNNNPIGRSLYDILRSIIGNGITYFSGSDGLSWNAGGCCGSASETTPRIDEIQFFRDLITYIQNKLSEEQDFILDMDRIYVTGMSNGGFMTHRVACEMSDLIAAAAPVAGPMMDNRYKQTTLGFKGDDTFECKPERPVPILHIHSEKDRIVPFAKDTSDQSLGFPGVPETIEIWRKLNGVDSSNNVVSTITTFGPRMVTPVYPFYRTFSTTCTKYELSKNDPKKDSTAVVELCKHDSDIAVGHCWPSFGERNIFGFVNPLELTTGHCLNGLGNQYIWNFLKQHSMPSATVHRSANSLSSSSSSNSAIINDDPVASNVPITNNDATIDEL